MGEGGEAAGMGRHFYLRSIRIDVQDTKIAC